MELKLNLINNFKHGLELIIFLFYSLQSLCLSNTAIGKTTVGQVINLLSNDVNRFDRAATFLHYLWIGPLQSIVVTYFLWQEIGVSSLLSIIIMTLIIPFQGLFNVNYSNSIKKVM